MNQVLYIRHITYTYVYSQYVVEISLQGGLQWVKPKRPQFVGLYKAPFILQ